MKKFECFLKNLYYYVKDGYWGWGHTYDPDTGICDCGKDWNVGVYDRVSENAVRCKKCGIFFFCEEGDFINHKCK